MGRKKKTPLEVYAEKKEKEIVKTAKMEKELQKYGKKVHGGYLFTVGDMQKYFKDKEKKKKRK